MVYDSGRPAEKVSRSRGGQEGNDSSQHGVNVTYQFFRYVQSSEKNSITGGICNEQEHVYPTNVRALDAKGTKLTLKPLL